MKDKQSSLLHNYYVLTKPGIIYGNLLTTVAGYFVGAQGTIHLFGFLGVLFGTTGIIGSACVFNNYMDRNIDEKMERTKKRPSVTGGIPIKQGMIFATILGLLGSLILLKYTNNVTFFVGLIGFFDYVLLYGYSKRKSIHGTLVGSISGAMPIVAGYTAATNRLDLGALFLFLILAAWQMPHFYAIAIYRLKDYTAANIPVLPVKNGILQTKIQILLYTIIFFITIILLTIHRYTSFMYLIVMGAISIWWLYNAAKGFVTKDATKWSRKMFFFSLIIITVLSVILPLDTIFQHGILIVW